MMSSILSKLPGVREIRKNPGPESLIEVDYYDEDGSSIIRLNAAHDTLSLSWLSDSALRAALLIQAKSPESCHAIDLSYSFDVDLGSFANLEELKNAIARVREDA
jgi:hypothetical protein